MEHIILTPAGPHRGLVALDLDQTLWPCMDAVALACRERFGITHPNLERDIVATWGGLSDHAGDRVGEVFAAALAAEQMLRVGLYPGAAEITTELTGAGYRVAIVTHRPPESAAEVAGACRALGISADEYFVGFADKISHCCALGARVLVDDKPETIAAAAAAGLPVLTLAHPYNAEVCRLHGVRAAADWAQLRIQLLDLLGEQERLPVTATA